MVERLPMADVLSNDDFVARYGPWAVVTGAAQGVGLAFAEELLSRGLAVILLDRDPKVEAVAAGLTGETRSVVADLTDAAWLDTLGAATSDLEIGLAVANAGISFVGNYLDMNAQERRDIVAINATATAEMASWALPAMVARKRGGFVVTSSGSAFAGTAGVSLYSATKAFVMNLSEAIGWELRNTGVDTLAFLGPSMATPTFLEHKSDPSKMATPAVDPTDVVGGVLDQLPEGGRWVPEGMELLATLPRSQQVDIMSSSTTGMYPHIWP